MAPGHSVGFTRPRLQPKRRGWVTPRHHAPSSCPSASIKLARTGSDGPVRAPKSPPWAQCASAWSMGGGSGRGLHVQCTWRPPQGRFSGVYVDCILLAARAQEGGGPVATCAVNSNTAVESETTPHRASGALRAIPLAQVALSCFNTPASNPKHSLGNAAGQWL